VTNEELRRIEERAQGDGPAPSETAQGLGVSDRPWEYYHGYALGLLEQLPCLTDPTTDIELVWDRVLRFARQAVKAYTRTLAVMIRCSHVTPREYCTVKRERTWAVQAAQWWECHGHAWLMMERDRGER
jgi:hypothetical protein